jgi:hypothetical protein
MNMGVLRGDGKKRILSMGFRCLESTLFEAFRGFPKGWCGAGAIGIGARSHRPLQSRTNHVH